MRILSTLDFLKKKIINFETLREIRGINLFSYYIIKKRNIKQQTQLTV